MIRCMGEKWKLQEVRIVQLSSFFQPGIQRRRLIMTLAGVSISGVSVAFFKQAAFGVDPFQSFCNGLHQVIPISFGTLYMLINVAMLLVAFLCYRKYIGIATFINLFLLGYLIEFSEMAIAALFGPPTMAMRVGYIIFGMVVLCFASSLYITADLGVSTYDAVALFLTEKKIAPFRFIRIGTDLICVAVGWIFGYLPGVGTVLTAFCMGPLISLFCDKFAKPMLYGKEK